MEVIQDNMTYILIAVVVVILIGAIILLLIRRRAASSQDIPMPDIGDPVDYTSMPVEEAANNRFSSLPERFANLPIPVRIALFAAPVLIIGLVVIGILVMQVSDTISATQQEASSPPPPPPELTIDTARLASADSILIEARGRNIPNGTTVQAALLAGGEPFPWHDEVGASKPISGNDLLQFRLNRLPDAPVPEETLTYTVQLQASIGEQTVRASSSLEIPEVARIRNGFFQKQPAAKPTPRPTPTPPPTHTPIPEIESPEPAAPPTDTPVATVTPISQPLLVARVFNGGNVRATPGGEPIIDQVHAGEEATLLQKTEDSVWYQVRTERTNVGWVHNTLLEQEDLAQVGPQVPVEGTTEPSPTPLPPGVTLGPTLDLTATPTTELTNAPSPLPTDTPSAEAPGDEEAPPPAGPQVSVFNGGNVRATPGGAPILDQVNANETVTLIKKNADGTWYQMRNERGVVGWVHYTLLNQDELAGVSAQVPVGE